MKLESRETQMTLRVLRPVRAFFMRPSALKVRFWLPYVELSKPRVIPLIMMTTLAGYWLGCNGDVDWSRFANVLIGTALAAAGANALNQCLEVDRDCRMRRTRHRPLPSGRLTPRSAWIWSLAVAGAGPLVLALTTNLLTAVLALIAEIVYVAFYTPLKLRTSLSLLVGAISGAMPPLMGWAAASGEIHGKGLVLAALVFVWQVPHSLSFGWIHREDYGRGGFRTLSVTDRAGELTGWISLTFSFVLFPLALASGSGSENGLPVWCAFLLAALLMFPAAGFCVSRTKTAARRVFLASVIYLPCILGILAVDSWL